MDTETHHSSISTKGMIRRFPSKPQFSNQESVAVHVVCRGARQLRENAASAIAVFAIVYFHATVKCWEANHLQFPGCAWECLVQTTFQLDFHE